MSLTSVRALFASAGVYDHLEDSKPIPILFSGAAFFPLGQLSIENLSYTQGGQMGGNPAALRRSEAGLATSFLAAQGSKLMSVFADLYLAPGGLIAWLVVGLVAGFLAGKVMKGSGYGLIGDLIVGLIGAFLGGLLFGSFVSTEYALIGSIVVAFIGACILIAVVRFVAPGRSKL
jgi:uncharacterized membrane protein YeaQ/YmgE (transglycosylase-associated protein family)